MSTLRSWSDKNRILYGGMYAIQHNPGAVDIILEMWNDRYRSEYISAGHISQNTNPRIIKFLEQHPELINWEQLSKNTSAGRILERNIDKIDWERLSENSSRIAVNILKTYPEKIDWGSLSKNSHPEAASLLLENPNNIVWAYLSTNNNPDIVDYMLQNRRKIRWDFANINSDDRIVELLIRDHPDQIDASFSSNPSDVAIDYLLENPEKINWQYLCRNTNPRVIPLWKRNKDKLNWIALAENPLVFNFIHEEELMEHVFHPRNYEKFWGWGIEGFDEPEGYENLVNNRVSPRQTYLSKLPSSRPIKRSFRKKMTDLFSCRSGVCEQKLLNGYSPEISPTDRYTREIRVRDPIRSPSRIRLPLEFGKGRNTRKSTRKSRSTRKTRKSTRKTRSARKTRKSTRKTRSVRKTCKSTRKSTRKTCK